MKKVVKYIAVFIALFICVIALIPLTVMSVSVQAQVVIPNADFEGASKMNNSFVVPDWNVNIISPLFISKDENSYDGAGLKIKKDCELVTKNTFSISAGKYRAGVYLKSESTAGTASVKIELYDSDRVLKNTVLGSKTISQFDWTDVSIDFVVSEEIESAKFTIKLAGINGECCVDSAFVSEIIEVDFPELTTMPGASLRLVTDSSGIRFHGKVDKVQYDEFCQKYSNASVGMLVSIKDNIEGLEEFTKQNLVDANKLFLEIQARKWYNEDTAEQDGYYGFYCAIANILQKNIHRYFVFRTYAKCVVNNVEYVTYGNYDEKDNSRSVRDIACKLYENIGAYDESQQIIIQDYVNAPKIED